MINTVLKKEIISQIDKLDTDQQRKVLDFARALALATPRGVPGSNLLALAGTISPEDLKIMSDAIEEDCEKVDLSEW